MRLRPVALTLVVFAVFADDDGVGFQCGALSSGSGDCPGALSMPQLTDEPVEAWLRRHDEPHAADARWTASKPAWSPPDRRGLVLPHPKKLGAAVRELRSFKTKSQCVARARITRTREVLPLRLYNVATSGWCWPSARRSGRCRSWAGCTTRTRRTEMRGALNCHGSAGWSTCRCRGTTW